MENTPDQSGSFGRRNRDILCSLDHEPHHESAEPSPVSQTRKLHELLSNSVRAIRTTVTQWAESEYAFGDLQALVPRTSKAIARELREGTSSVTKRHNEDVEEQIDLERREKAERAVADLTTDIDDFVTIQSKLPRSRVRKERTREGIEYLQAVYVGVLPKSIRFHSGCLKLLAEGKIDPTAENDAIILADYEERLVELTTLQRDIGRFLRNIGRITQ